MIIPFWLRSSYFMRAPVTLMILIVGVFFYLVLPMKNSFSLPKDLSQKISNHNFISIQSYLYENYIKINKPEEWRYWENRFYERNKSIKEKEWVDFWFQTSFKDGDFLLKATNLPPHSDSIRYDFWKKAFIEYKNFQKSEFTGLFGISNQGIRWSHYITYQFIHSGFLHLFSNMMILLFFGVMIELQVGSWVCLSLFLIGGVVGAVTYGFFTGNNMAPLIGSSGSVSTLLSFYLLTEPRQNLRFFFFFFPSEEYFGDIYLSKWWLIPLLILTDINTLLAYPDWSLTVAHSVHLGSIVFGVLAALVAKAFSINFRLNETLSWVNHPEEIISQKEDEKWII